MSICRQKVVKSLILTRDISTKTSNLLISTNVRSHVNTTAEILRPLTVTWFANYTYFLIVLPYPNSESFCLSFLSFISNSLHILHLDVFNYSVTLNTYLLILPVNQGTEQSKDEFCRNSEDFNSTVYCC